MGRAARLVGAWCGRLVLLLTAFILVLVATGDTEGSRIDLLSLPLGAAFAGGLLMTFKATARAGLWLAAGGVWATLTGYGLVAVIDPDAAIADSQRGQRNRIDSRGGAYLQGAFFLLVANAFPALWAWGRVRRERRSQRS